MCLCVGRKQFPAIIQHKVLPLTRLMALNASSSFYVLAFPRELCLPNDFSFVEKHKSVLKRNSMYRVDQQFLSYKGLIVPMLSSVKQSQKFQFSLKHKLTATFQSRFSVEIFKTIFFSIFLPPRVNKTKTKKSFLNKKTFVKSRTR